MALPVVPERFVAQFPQPLENGCGLLWGSEMGESPFRLRLRGAIGYTALWL